MTLKTTILLEPTIVPSFSEPFTLYNDSTSATLTCSGLLGSESAVLEYKDEITSTWHPYLTGGVIASFSSSNAKLEISNNFDTLRLNKSATTNAVGIYCRQWLS